MKFSYIAALAIFSSALAAPVNERGLNVAGGLNIGGLNLGLAVGAKVPTMDFGAGFSVDTCKLSMKAWLQAKGLCEADGSLGAKAQAYLNGALSGKTCFEGLFGMGAGFQLKADGGLLAGVTGALDMIAGVNANAGLDMTFKGAISGLMKGGVSGGVKVDAGAQMDIEVAMKAWLQAKGLCEADGSIGAKAKAYINMVLGGKVGFEGLLGMSAGFKLGGGVSGLIGGFDSGKLVGACNGLISGGLQIGGQLSGNGTCKVCAGSGNGNTPSPPATLPAIPSPAPVAPGHDSDEGYGSDNGSCKASKRSHRKRAQRAQ